MRRRRQKNPLLMRIIVISIVVHIFALPVLAHFGAFKKIHDHYVEANMVVLPPPPAVKEEKPVVQKKQQVAKAPAAKKGPASVTHHGPSAPHAHVAISNGPGTGDGPTIDQGTLKQGELPPPPADNGPKKTDTNATTQVPEKAVVEAKPPTPSAPPVETKPEPKKEIVTTVVPPPPVVHEPVFTQATPLEGHQPQPSIPDDLRSDALDKTFIAEVVVGPDGMPTSVMVSQSTGSNELDHLAMDTAKQWRFKPATRDGQPVESRVRLHIEFQVN